MATTFLNSNSADVPRNAGSVSALHPQTILKQGNDTADSISIVDLVDQLPMATDGKHTAARCFAIVPNDIFSRVSAVGDNKDILGKRYYVRTTTPNLSASTSTAAGAEPIYDCYYNLNHNVDVIVYPSLDISPNAPTTTLGWVTPTAKTAVTFTVDPHNAAAYTQDARERELAGSGITDFIFFPVNIKTPSGSIMVLRVRAPAGKVGSTVSANLGANVNLELTPSQAQEQVEMNNLRFSSNYDSAVSNAQAWASRRSGSTTEVDSSSTRLREIAQFTQTSIFLALKRTNPQGSLAKEAVTDYLVAMGAITSATEISNYKVAGSGQHATFNTHSPASSVKILIILGDATLDKYFGKYDEPRAGAIKPAAAKTEEEQAEDEVHLLAAIAEREAAAKRRRTSAQASTARRAAALRQSFEADQSPQARELRRAIKDEMADELLNAIRDTAAAAVQAAPAESAGTAYAADNDAAATAQEAQESGHAASYQAGQ